MMAERVACPEQSIGINDLKTIRLARGVTAGYNASIALLSI